MVHKFYKILDKNGIEMPNHWSGRERTYEEAKKMVDNLNKNGEYSPYTMIEINGDTKSQNESYERTTDTVKKNKRIRSSRVLRHQANHY